MLAKQAARDQGAREAWLVDAQGRVTEGASSNAWIVSRDGKLITRPLGRDILPGITRSVVLDVIKAQGLAFEERAFSVEEAYAAREAFITSASQIVLPVVSIDGRPVGNGAPGLIATALRRDYHRHAEIALNSGPRAGTPRMAANDINISYFSGLSAADANLCLRPGTRLPSNSGLLSRTPLLRGAKRRMTAELACARLGQRRSRA